MLATHNAGSFRLVQANRRFPSRDPGLPVELQPSGWSGERARLLFNEAHHLLGPPARAFYEEVVGTPVQENRQGAVETDGSGVPSPTG